MKRCTRAIQVRRWAVGGAVTLALSLAACSHSEKPESKADAAAATPSVAVAQVQKQDLSRGVTLTAEFRPFQEVDIMAKVAGYVKKMYVDVGDRVQKDQVLATLEVPEMADDLARAKASLERSNSEVARARDEVNRAETANQNAHLSYERLAGVNQKKPGLVAQQEIDDAQSKDLVSAAQVSAAKSALAAATQGVDVSKAEQGRTRTLFDYTRVAAPFAGVVTKRFADTGSMIQAGTASQTQAMPIVRLSENTLLRLILPVPESAVPRIRVGEHVAVHVPTLNRSFPGTVARFDDQLQLSTRTMDTEVDVQNANLLLIPGMYAEVNLTLDQHNGALAVPVGAVDLSEAGASEQGSGRVMLVDSSHRLQSRAVQIGMETATYVEIRSGLNEGDMVVIGSRSGLQAGQTVIPKLTALSATKAE